MTFLRITVKENGRAQSEAVAVPSDIRLSEEQKANALLEEKDRNRRATQFGALNPIRNSEHQPHPPRVEVGLLEEVGAVIPVPEDPSTPIFPQEDGAAATSKKEKVK